MTLCLPFLQEAIPKGVAFLFSGNPGGVIQNPELK